MKKLILLFILFSLNAYAEDLKMECDSVKRIGAIKRCENKEVVCYSSYEGSLQCKFK